MQYVHMWGGKQEQRFKRCISLYEYSFMEKRRGNLKRRSSHACPMEEGERERGPRRSDDDADGNGSSTLALIQSTTIKGDDH